MLKRAFFAICLGVLSYTIFVIVILHNNGFSYALVDTNQNGFASPSEAIRALDMGIQKTSIDGDECKELFSLKDGLPIKVICETSDAKS